MMKSVALPIAEAQASMSRASERDRLLKSEVITVAEQKTRIDKLNEEIEKESTSMADAIAAISGKDVAEEQKRDQILEIQIQTDLKIHGVAARRQSISDMMTAEDRAARLLELDQEDQRFGNSFGPQPLTAEDIAQRNADKVAQAEYVEKRKYHDDRAGEYPSIGDQLDALWKGGRDADDMAQKVKAVKEKYPKPE